MDLGRFLAKQSLARPIQSAPPCVSLSEALVRVVWVLEWEVARGLRPS